MLHTSRKFLLCALLPIFVFSFSGCIPKIGGGGSTGQPAPIARSPLDEARDAFRRGEYGRAEALARRLMNDGGNAETARILAASAMRVAPPHPNVALEALDGWRKVEPGADSGREWQDMWCAAARQLGTRDARAKADALYRDESRNPGVRAMAGILLAVSQWEDGELGGSLPTLEALYEAAGNSRAKAGMEARLAVQLDKAAPAASNLAAGAVTPENQGRYPYSIILVDQLRRKTRNPAERAEAEAALAALAREIRLADASLFKKLPSAVEYSAPAAPIESGPITGKPVVLALPMGEKFAGISGKIKAGAEAACAEMRASGSSVSLVVIDTTQPDWTARIQGLPADAVVVGGFLKNSDYTAAKKQGLTARRAVFAFLPALEGGDEGRAAWRFFPSPADQANALLPFAAGLGIKGYGILSPDDAYGRRMAEMFAAKASGQGFGVYRASYAPNSPAGWLRSVGELLASNKNPQHAGGATFQAIFLPDTWKNMDVIVSSIFYYNETRQVLLGSSLWEQGMAGGNFNKPEYWELAVFPGAWNKMSPSPAAQRLSGKIGGGADFWSGLGYDFARMAASLSVQPGWNSSGVNAALQSSANMDWSMAPMRWDAAGLNSQDLYLFTPTAGGPMPVDAAAFRAKFASSWK